MSRYDPISPARLAWENGSPRSLDYDDVYFSRDGGLAETRHVFLSGNDLPRRFRHAQRFTLGEIGFGSGLNFLAAMALWDSIAPAGATLHYLAVEQHPFTSDDLVRAQAAWPELAPHAAELAQVYPPLVNGYHRRELRGGRVVLLLLFGNADAMLADLHARVDAWFLDGFAPRHNPALWSRALFDRIASLTGNGGTLATYSAAGAVRRGLEAAGFEIRRSPGFGRKREMSCGRLIRATAPPPRSQPWFALPPATMPETRQAIVVGAGLAGSTTAHALARRGWQVTVLEREAGVARGASGNPAGIVLPRLTADMNIDGRFYLGAFLHTSAWLTQLQDAGANIDWHGNGVWQRMDEHAYARLQGLQLPTEVLDWLPATASQAQCGITLHSDGVLYRRGGWLSPVALCRRLLADSAITLQFNTHVVKLTQLDDSRWALQLTDGNTYHADVVIIANGHAATQLGVVETDELQAVRGQLALLRADAYSRALRLPLCDENYVLPAHEGLHCIGATYDWQDLNLELRPQDNAWLAQQAGRWLPEIGSVEGGRVAFRASTPDRLPLIGAAPARDFYRQHYGDLHHGRPASLYPLARYQTGLYLSLGHGSRGLVSCPIAAEFLAAIINAEPTPLPNDLAAAVHPARFLIRRFRRR